MGTSLSSFMTRKRLLSLTAALLVLLTAGMILLGRMGDAVVPMFFQRVSAQSPLRMTFPSAMDHASVQEHLTLPSDVKGSTEWEGDTLVFHATTPLLKDERYDFFVSRDALTAAQQPLGRDLTYSFVVSGEPALVSAVPGSGALNVPKNAAITLVFDRPIVSLQQIQGSVTATQWPVTIVPPIAGGWRWISTYAAQFTPKEGLELGTKYTVQVPTGIELASGEKTTKDFSWSFQTLRPTLVSTSPEQGNTLAGPTTPITLTFNQPMNLQSAREHIQLYRSLGTGALALPTAVPPATKDELIERQMQEKGNKVPLQTATGGAVASLGTLLTIADVKYGTTEKEGKKILDPTTLIAVPAQPLAFSSTYRVVVQQGIRGAEGEQGSETGTVLSFQTVGPLQVKDTNANESRFLSLTFNNPIDAATVHDGITYAPVPENWKDTTLNTNVWGDNCRVTGFPTLKPSTTYTVTVNTSLADTFGQHLSKPFTFQVTTPQTDPRISIQSHGDFGIFERGKEPIYYLNGVNVSQFSVTLAPLSVATFLQMQKDRQNGSDEPVDPTNLPDAKSWTIPAKKKLNTWEIQPFDVEKQAGATLAPGLYALTVQAPEYKSTNRYGQEKPVVLTQYFAITDLSITLKYSGNRALVWVTNMETGAPVPQATVTFHTLSGKDVVTGNTDAEGFFESAVDSKQFVNFGYEWQPEFYVTAESAGDFSFVGSAWQDGIRPEDFSLWSDYRGPQSSENRMDAYVYTERPLYAAGDTVHFKGIVRVRDRNGVMTTPSSNQIIVAANDANGREFYRKTLSLSAFGSFQDDVALDKNAALGSYWLNAQLPPESGTGNDSGGTSFSVLAYRKPAYTVDLTAAKDDYVNGDTLTFPLTGAYYFGAPLAGAHVQWRAETTEYYFNKYTESYYSFGVDDHWCWYSCAPTTTQLTEGKGVLDSQGKMTIAFPADISKLGQSQVISVEANVSDADNQLVSARASSFVHLSKVYTGIRTSEYVLTPGQQAKADVITLHPDGTAASNQSVTVQLFSRAWNTVKAKGVDGQYYYDNQPKDTYVRSVSVTTGQDGKAQALLPVDQGGEYRLIASSKDDNGKETKASTTIYVWSSSYVNWPHANNDRISIEMDKPEYKVGETAVLLAKSPYQGKGVHALVTVERENVLSHTVLDVDSNAQTIKIPVTEEMVPNAFISVIIQKPRNGDTFDGSGSDTGAPAYKIGYAQLNVNTKEKGLQVKMTTDKERYGPGETVHVSLHVADAAGAPTKTELSVGVVDMSLLALAGFYEPDLVSTFWAQRGLGVMTASSLQHLLERFKPGSKGGGGGGDAASKVRGNFKDTAYWNPIVLTDKNGDASVNFQLPDNLTTWKLLAIGHTKNNLFGTTSKDIIETKQVLLRSVRPRFAVRGDRINIGVIVHNQLPTQQTFHVSLQGSGFVITGESSSTLTVPASEPRTVLFPIQVGTGNLLSFHYLATSEGGRDEVLESIPVYPFGTDQTVTTTGWTEQGVTEQVLVPTTNDASDGTLMVTASPTVATYLPAGLNAAIKYPYGCAEQTVSTFLPSVAVKMLQGYQAFHVVDDKTLETIVTSSIQKLYEFQRSDGGFGYWQDSGMSDPYLSAYVLQGLQLSRKAGYAVDSGVLSRAADFLVTALRNQDVKNTIDLSSRSFILFVLGESGRGDASLLSNLYDHRDGLPIFAKAYLAMALQSAGSTGRALTVAKEIEQNAKVDPRGAHFEEEKEQRFASLLHTNERSTALALQALVRIDPKNALLPTIVRYLLAVRTDGHWDTTQSTTASILALVDFLKSTGEMTPSFSATAIVNGKQLFEQSFDTKNALTRALSTLSFDSLQRGASNTVQIGKAGTGRLYYDVLMTYFYTPDTIEPTEQGMSIQRTLETLDGKETNLSSVSVGETYRILLTMTVPEDRHFVAVEDPLPAGLELIDSSFLTSQQYVPGGDQSVPWNYWSDDPISRSARTFTHEELRDDRLFLFAEEMPAGVYQKRVLVRATTSGRYRQRPARIWEMYYPETFGQSDGGWFTVKQ